MAKIIKKEELQEILSNAPPGSDPHKIIDILVSKGNRVDGVNFGKLEDIPKGKFNLIKDYAIGEKSPLEAIARLGRFANKGNQYLAILMAEKGGEFGAAVGRKFPEPISEVISKKIGMAASGAGGVLGTASEYLLPQNKLGAAAALIGGGLGIKNAISPATESIAPVSSKSSQIIKPGFFAKNIGSLMSVRNKVSSRLNSAVLADPTIFDESTPGIKEVGKMYQEAFKKAGMKVDSKELEKITGDPFPATPEEFGKLKKIVLNASKKLADSELNESEAFLARSAAAKIERSSRATRDPQTAIIANGFKSVFDNFLENSSLPNIRNLGKMYFRAIAKEAFESFVPLTKSKDPDSLRGLLMTYRAGKSLGNIAAGNIPGAAAEAISGASMSPRFLPAAIKTARFALGAPSSVATESAALSVPASIQALKNIRKQREKDEDNNKQ